MRDLAHADATLVLDTVRRERLGFLSTDEVAILREVARG